MPIAFPNIDPKIAEYLLWLAAGLLILAFLLWLWGFRGGNSGDGVTQTTHGPSSPNVQGNFHGPVTFNSPPPEPSPRPDRRGGGPIVMPLNQETADRMREAANPKADTPLAGVLVRVYKHLGPVPDRKREKAEFLEKVDLAIADAVVAKKLHTWGRFGKRALAPIEWDKWEHGEFSHIDKSLLVPVAYSGGYKLTDLHFLMREIDGIWPEPQKAEDDE